MSLFTRLPAPITTFEPILTPGMTATFAPNQTSSPTVIGWAYSIPLFLLSLSIGWPAVEKVQFGAIKTLSPKLTFAPSRIMRLWLA